METFDINVSRNIRVTTQDIDDIMCTALEGGVTYWCRKAKVVGEYLGDYASEQIARGGTLLLYDAEEDDVYELTRDKLLKGIELAVKDNCYSDYEWVNGDELDCCNVDGDVADAIVQFALFGEIMFG